MIQSDTKWSNIYYLIANDQSYQNSQIQKWNSENKLSDQHYQQDHWDPNEYIDLYNDQSLNVIKTKLKMIKMIK